MSTRDDDSLALFPPTAEARQAAPAAPRRAEHPSAPLADRMRPRSLDEVVGQADHIGPGAPLRVFVESGTLPSLLLWGPPGCGKTTLARLLAGDPARARFVALSAVTAGLKDVRAVVEQATYEARSGRRTVLFLDEIHRFNRAQQDALLPHVEHGTVTLIGATTENPSFEVIAPLLSRCRVFVLRPLTRDDLRILLRRAIGDQERGLGATAIAVDDEALGALADLADGDARRGLGLLEAAFDLARGRSSETQRVDVDTVREAAGRRLLAHDRDRDSHYDVVSAFIKSLRASDPDAALYWGARMLEAGEDPRFLTRRLMIFASEDVGNAEPAALPLALAAAQAVERVGMPEARIPLGQAIAFLACAPKSNASYLAIDAAIEAVRQTGSAPVPLHLRNAPTGLLRDLGHGRDYQYPHDAPDQFVAAPNLPESLRGARFYDPQGVGAEASIAQRIAEWRRRRESED